MSQQPAPVFNDELVKQWSPKIHGFCQNFSGYNTSDMYYDYDDLFQVGLMALYEATQTYDPKRGAKFGTHLHQLLFCRMGSVGNKFKEKNFLTSNMSSIPGGWGLAGTEIADEHDTTFSKSMSGAVNFNTADINNQILDAKIVYDRLQGDRKRIYADFYIKGKTVKEICAENKHLKYYQVRRVLKYLEQIHNTLVEGNVCLQ